MMPSKKQPKKEKTANKNDKLSEKTFKILKDAFEFMLMEDEDCAQTENGRGFNREDSFYIHKDFTGEVTEEFIINHGHRLWTYRKTQLAHNFKLEDLEAAIKK